MASTTLPEFAHLQIPLEDILNATNNFHKDNIIGHGGFGPAYKGHLQWSGNLIKIAARRLARKHREGDVDFWTEISVLSDLNHANLVSFIGFCDEKGEKVIITTYASKGSLKEHLNSPNLTWIQRLNISIGVARALSYLYYDEGRSYGIIHRNINSRTILLDDKFEAKLSGFEISIKQSINRMERVILSEPIGAIGYVDPEIEKSKGVTYKSDIYSFGVVLFEIMCGRRAYIENEANMFLAQLGKYHYENETLIDIVHPSLRNQMSPYSLKIYSKMAYSCLEEEGAHRPNILIIIDKLEKALKQALKFKPDFGKKLENLKIHLDVIKLATHNFSNTYKIESSDYYTWYKVKLDHFDSENPSSIEGTSKSELPKRHKTVVIKRFLPVDDEQEEEVFFTELEMLTSVKHRNIVNLLGFCVEGCDMMLITENFSNGCLRDYLGNVKEMCSLTWEKRLKICIDVAHALNYLHFEMEDEKMIIHSNITNSIIVFNDNWEAWIEDFEWAVFLHSNQKDKALYKKPYFDSRYHVDPEYMKTGKLKKESDVYSFGVVLFEIICGRHAHDQNYLKESDKGLVHVARQNYYMGAIEEMIDPTLKEENGKKSSISNIRANKDSLHTFLKVAYQCVAETQDQRPTMKVVLKELKKALFFQEVQAQQLDKDQAVNEHEIPEEQVQQVENGQSVDELEIASHEINPLKKLEHLKIHLTDIKLATDDFSKVYEIPSASVCTLYRAKLNHFGKENPSSVDGTVVIKRYPSGRKHYGEKEFFTEIEMLRSVKHPNIVTILGFCFEASEMILVIDDFPNGYLAHYLREVDKRRTFTWEKRLKICIDVARALHYLHYEMEDQKMIINRDITSYSIGLGEHLGAKIVDFWWSVSVPANQKAKALHLSWVGRPLYGDPVYKKTDKLKRESDVYSFGIVLFEILCGRTASDPIYKKDSDKGLAFVARRCYCSGTIHDIIDPIMKEEAGENNFVLNRGPNKDSLHTFIEIAYQCMAETQDQRPTMKAVVNELEKAFFLQNNKMNNPKISFEDIKVATQNFNNANHIGGGGFGRVFKGELQDDEGSKTIVAKRLDTRLGQGEQQFWNLLQILLEYKHENIIGLIGYCDEKDEKVIVYEYAPKRSLDRYLKDASLTWEQRLVICIDVATALCFLHGGARKQAKVIHRDIKTANILLNHEWKAKLGDFGLSLISPITQKTNYVIDYACGTPGYVDPLYKNSRFLTIESDIYSFGVVLFEILCGRSTLEIHKHNGHYLPDFIIKNFEERKHNEVVFEQIKEQIVPKSLTTFQDIAYQCLHKEREKRPTTIRVLMKLKKALEIQNMASTMTKFARLQIPLEDIVKATNNFDHDNIIGNSGFSITYKGQLSQSTRLMKIAAQRFDCKHMEANLKFLREITVLYDLNHTNVVSIIGFCDEKDEKIIVTTYEANGSLGQYLNNPSLSWTQRLKISIGVARALSYLHSCEGRDYSIIHCNINSDIIVLDEIQEAKLSGFETSIKLSISNKDQISHCEQIGLKGCIDPTIGKMGGVTYKSDIYSFGVVLFEILCGRKAFIENGANRFLAPLAKDHYENGTLYDIVHPDLWKQMSTQSLFKYSRVAYSCLKEEYSDRPNADDIVDTLVKALESQLNNENNLEHLKIRLTDIKLATNNFSESYKIEPFWVGFSLYRGELEHFDKENPSSEEGENKGKHFKRVRTVVIKRYLSGDPVFTEVRFFTELEMLTSVKHQNIITLLGFCVEDSEMILVTENVSNGYLGSYLGKVNQMRILNWEKRLKICIDVAKSLNYLHSDMEDQKMMINRDIQSYNIGLDEKWGAKITGFAFSVFLPPSEEDKALYHDMTWGTKGYRDPDYEKTHKLKRESDVYSFGVVLFEILCGRRANDPLYKNESNKGLAHVARRSFSTGTLEDMIDPLIKEENSENNLVSNRGLNKDSLNTFIEIAYQCVAETQDQRPTMNVVVKELEKALSFSSCLKCRQEIGVYSTF